MYEPLSLRLNDDHLIVGPAYISPGSWELGAVIIPIIKWFAQGHTAGARFKLRFSWSQSQSSSLTGLAQQILRTLC